MYPGRRITFLGQGALNCEKPAPKKVLSSSLGQFDNSSFILYFIIHNLLNLGTLASAYSGLEGFNG